MEQWPHIYGALSGSNAILYVSPGDQSLGTKGFSRRRVRWRGGRACQGPCLAGWLGLASWENGGLKRRRKPPVSAAIFPETFVEL